MNALCCDDRGGTIVNNCSPFNCPLQCRTTEGATSEVEDADELEPVTWCEADEVGDIAEDECDSDEELSGEERIEKLLEPIDAEE